MISGNENIITWFKAQKRPCWRLRKSANSDVIAYSQIADPTDDEGLEELKSTFNYLSSGQYFLECWKGSDKKNWARCTVQIDGTAGNNTNPEITGFSIGEIEEKINEGVEKYKTEEKYKKMEEENARLLEQHNSLQTQLLTRITPYIDLIGKISVKYLGGDPTSITTEEKKKVINPENQKQMNQELLEKAGNALDIWYEIDPEAVEMMISIAKLAKENPPMYQQAKNLLKSM